MNILTRGLNLTSVTIFNMIDGNYKRSVVKNCLWRMSSSSSFKTQGTLPLDTVKIYITDYLNYVSEENYNGNGWTVKLGSDKNKTYIVKGECDFNFTSNSDKEFYDKIRYFENNYEYVCPKSVDNNVVGIGDVDHIMIIC